MGVGRSRPGMACRGESVASGKVRERSAWGLRRGGRGPRERDVGLGPTRGLLGLWGESGATCAAARAAERAAAHPPYPDPTPGSASPDPPLRVGLAKVANPRLKGTRAAWRALLPLEVFHLFPRPGLRGESKGAGALSLHMEQVGCWKAAHTPQRARLSAGQFLSVKNNTCPTLFWIECVPPASRLTLSPFRVGRLTNIFFFRG
jgi:hypothetical protein